MSSWFSALTYTRWSSGDAAFLAKISGGPSARPLVVQLNLETVARLAAETHPVWDLFVVGVMLRSVHSKWQHLKISFVGWQDEAAWKGHLWAINRLRNSMCASPSQTSTNDTSNLRSKTLYFEGVCIHQNLKRFCPTI
jgi:hypothetical protein